MQVINNTQDLKTQTKITIIKQFNKQTHFPIIILYIRTSYS